MIWRAGPSWRRLLVRHLQAGGSCHRPCDVRRRRGTQARRDATNATEQPASAAR